MNKKKYGPKRRLWNNLGRLEPKHFKFCIHEYKFVKQIVKRLHQLLYCDGEILEIN